VLHPLDVPELEQRPTLVNPEVPPFGLLAREWTASPVATTTTSEEDLDAVTVIPTPIHYNRHRQRTGTHLNSARPGAGLVAAMGGGVVAAMGGGVGASGGASGTSRSRSPQAISSSGVSSSPRSPVSTSGSTIQTVMAGKNYSISFI